jgi:hypothetical protein
VVTLKPAATLLQLCSFMQWLVKHAPLVKSITAIYSCWTSQFTVHGLPWEQYVAAAQQLLQQALQLAASQAATIPAAAARILASSTSQQQQQQQQQRRPHGLRLSSFTSNCLVTPDTLAALPAHSLTHLDVELVHSKALDGAVMAAALAQLSSLQHLSLSNNSCKPVPGRCLLGLRS